MHTTYNYGANLGGSSDTPYPAGSGHAAGYKWAQDKGITDSADCGGTGSFNAGCVAYCTDQKTNDADSNT